LIAHLLQKQPADRPASADALVALIDDAIAALGDRRAAASTSTSRRATGASHRRLGVATAAALGALGAFALSAAGVTAYRLFSTEATPDEPEPSEPAPGKIVSASGEPLRLIPRDDGELIVRTLVPEVIHAGVPIRAHLEIKTKLGGQFNAKQVVITVEDPHHNATAHTAAMREARPGHYGFRHTFTEPGSYTVRIFPSETETMSTIDLDVVP